MKLYYKGGACSLASHIIAREAGFDLDLEEVDLNTKKTESGADFYTINPKGYVPTLILDDGEVMTESAVILQYVADQVPSSGLIPTAGSIERYRVLQVLNFIGGEIHKGLWPLLDPLSTDAIKQATMARLGQKFAVLEERLQNQEFLAGDVFGVADSYAFAILNGARHFGADLSAYPRLCNLLDRIAARPAVLEAMKKERLIPA